VIDCMHREQLVGSPPGTFLVRLSNKDQHRGWLALSFTDDDGGNPTRITRCLIDVRQDGFVIFFQTGSHRYDTLQELVANCVKLRTLHPAIQKEHAFRNFPW